MDEININFEIKLFFFKIKRFFLRVNFFITVEKICGKAGCCWDWNVEFKILS